MVTKSEDGKAKKGKGKGRMNRENGDRRDDGRKRREEWIIMWIEGLKDSKSKRGEYEKVKIVGKRERERRIDGWLGREEEEQKGRERFNGCRALMCEGREEDQMVLGREERRES